MMPVLLPLLSCIVYAMDCLDQTVKASHCLLVIGSITLVSAFCKYTIDWFDRQDRIRESYEENESLDEICMCGLCMVKVVDSVYLPCGHQFSCFGCAAKYKTKKCPLCRTKCNRICQTYMAGFSR